MIKVHHAFTLRSKRVDRHQYCWDLSLKILGNLRTFKDFRGVLCGPNTFNAHLLSTLGSKESIDTHIVGVKG